jgi:D-glycero-D-manno-heptose 1,7-bisphosphate phosphatase
MPIRNLILDRDGVINEVIIREGVVSAPWSLDEFKLFDEFVRLHDEAAKRQLKMFVVSNQPDVSRKLLPEEVLQSMTDQLQRFSLTEIFYCRHENHHECTCRKPKPGMIVEILSKYSLRPDETVMVGDSHKDVGAGQGAGVRTIYVRRAYNREFTCKPDFIVDSLDEIMGIISTL